MYGIYTLSLRLLPFRQPSVHQDAEMTGSFAFLAGLSWSLDGWKPMPWPSVLDSARGVSHAPVDMDLVFFLEDASKMMCLRWV